MHKKYIYLVYDKSRMNTNLKRKKIEENKYECRRVKKKIKIKLGYLRANTKDG